MVNGLRSRGVAVLCSALALALSAAPGSAGLRPKTLLIYYGYPTSINQTFTAQAAAPEFGRYDYVFWGDGLEDPAHPDHANALAILADPSMASTRVFGSVDLGVSTQNLPISEVQARIGRWKAMGVAGVMLNDFGYDFDVSRDRQNAAVDFAHAQGLAVIANAVHPEDAMGDQVDAAHNGLGVATRLGATDFYLYENQGVVLGAYEGGAGWQAKTDALEGYRRALGVRVLSIATSGTDDPAAYDESRFFYAWYAALLAGHEATGWGEFGFSAVGASNGHAPFRTRPAIDPGSVFTTDLTHEGSLHSRDTDVAHIWLDSSEHTFAFVPNSAGVEPPGGAPARALVASPNPTGADARVVFTLSRRGVARLVILSAGGRLMATLADAEFAPGRHDALWNGRDRDGRPVAPGVYFAVLTTAGRRDIARVAVLR